jgi:serine/threonine protein kinase
MTADASNAALQDLAPNSTFGPYRIARLLGKGGMGAVYEAEDPTDGRVVALKLLSVDLDKMDARERFLREGQTAAAINHPNAVYIYGTEEIDGTPAITMELVPGGTLEDKVKSRGPLPWAEAVEDIIQVIDGLDAALTAGVLHRDVKPSNCFVGSGGNVKIGDFGLSKPVDGAEQQKLTKTGLFLGTPVYSSPEQLLGETLDVRSDIYAVGVTMYYLLTGELPYSSGSMMQVVAAVLNGEPAPLSKYRADVPQPVIDVVMKAIARKAVDRYQTYDEFRAALVKLRAAEVTPARISDRFRAEIVDDFLVWASLKLISIALVYGVGLSDNDKLPSVIWRDLVITVVLAVAIRGIPEGLRGVSVGKWLLGLRVVDDTGLAPGIARAVARVLLLSSIDVLSSIVSVAIKSEETKSTISVSIYVLFYASLFITARRRNGWRLLHDVLTKTRVVVPQAMVAARRGEASRVVAPTLTGSERIIGPYAVIGAAPVGEGVLLGWDRGMQRAVWIVPCADDDAETSVSRRIFARLTRMRWVGGRRAPGDSWDAYEAPQGESLTSRLTRPVPWHVEQNWLEDVADELAARETLPDETWPMGIDRLWVTPTDRLIFVEGRTSLAARASASGASPVATVHELIDRVAASRLGTVPLPLHATAARDSARCASSSKEMRVAIRATLGRSGVVTRARRAALMLTVIAPAIAVVVATWYAVRFQSRDGAGKLAALYSFVGDSIRNSPDSTKARALRDSLQPNRSYRIGKAFRRLSGNRAAAGEDSQPSIETLRMQRRLVEIYISTELKAQVADSSPRFINTISRANREGLKRIIARTGHVDSADASAARQLVDSTWRRGIPGSAYDTFELGLPLFVGLVVLALTAIASIALTLIVRRGALTRGFALEVVTPDGRAAGRLRSLLRAAFTWMGPIVMIFAYASATRVSTDTLATLIVFAVIATCALGLGVLITNLRTPSRGLAERLSGTYLVPE